MSWTEIEIVLALRYSVAAISAPAFAGQKAAWAEVVRLMAKLEAVQHCDRR